MCKGFRTSSGSRVTIAAVLCAVLVFAAVPAEATILVPPPDPPNNSLLFGDFTVYSMAFLHFLDTNGINGPSSGDPWYIDSSPGLIGPPTDLVIASFPNGNLPNLNASADDAYKTQHGAPLSYYTFATSASAPDPPPSPPTTFAGDIDGAWDVRISALQTVLAGEDLLFWFNMNESGNKAELSGQDLLAWATVTLHDEALVAPDKVYTLYGGYSNSDRSDWAYVHSDITVWPSTDPASRYLYDLGPPSAAEKALGFEGISQNLGANNAAFGAYNAELNNLVASGPYDLMRVRLELGMMNDGYEQLFIRAATVIPEPASIVVWSFLATLAFGLGVWRRGRRNTIGEATAVPSVRTPWPEENRAAIMDIISRGRME